MAAAAVSTRSSDEVILSASSSSGRNILKRVLSTGVLPDRKEWKAQYDVQMLLLNGLDKSLAPLVLKLRCTSEQNVGAKIYRLDEGYTFYSEG